MGALTASEMTTRSPAGDRFESTWRVTTGSADQTADYAATGWMTIDAITGIVQIGGAPAAVRAPVAATATVTFIPTDPTDEDTITVDGIIYHIQSGSLVDYDVTLSATEATMAANFAHAINRDSAQGNSVYSANTAAHPTVKASVSGAVVTLTARVPGTAGNAITLAKSSTGCTVSGATFTGGLDGKAAINVRKNAKGVGVTEGTDPGFIGIEVTEAAVVLEITAIGRA